jgi:hypothetical protein
MDKKAWLSKTETLHYTLVASCTQDIYPIGDYAKLRLEFINNKTIEEILPDFIAKYRTLEEFRQFIKDKFGHYDERRQFLKDKFSILYKYLEGSQLELDAVITKKTMIFNQDYIDELWQKALKRRETDPDGAITIARTLLEATCKHILDKSGLSESYSEKTDLPTLYSNAAKLLNLSPSQYTEQQFKQILGGCMSVVNGLASIRNKASDAHGRGISGTKPSSRHATLCVNMAGTMAVFLIETWEKHQG